MKLTRPYAVFVRRKVGISASPDGTLVVTRSGSLKTTSNRPVVLQNRPMAKDEFHPEREGDFSGGYILSGKSNVKKIRDKNNSKVDSRSRSLNSSGNSLANRSYSSNSFASMSRHTQPPRFIETPLLSDDASVESPSDPDASQFDDSCLESRNDEEIRWMTRGHRSDYTTTGISTIDGGSMLGVDSPIADPTAICGLIQDAMYRDLRNFFVPAYSMGRSDESEAGSK